MSRERGRNFSEWPAPALTNGLETRLPPNKLSPSFSPDLNNVMLNSGAVSKRGGFTPFVREHPKLNSIVNRGFRRSATVPGGSATALNVPGRLLAGDRAQYDDVDAVTLDFFVRVDDLSPSTALATLESSTNDRYSGITDGRVKISCRPIISKGPSKKAVLLQRDVIQQYADRYGPDTTAKGFCAWDPTHTWGPGARFHAATCTSAGSASGARQFTTAQPHGLTTGDQVRLYGSVLAGAAASYDFVYTATVIGPTIVQFTLANAATNGEEVTLVSEPATVGHALPWAVYLWNEGTADVADFKFEFATVGRDLSAGEYVLKRLQSTIDVVEGSVYHVIASVDWTDKMVLRIGRWDAVNKTFGYTAVEDDLSGDGLSPPLNPVGPIQVFDIPIEFAEFDSANQDIWDTSAFTSRPPGLALAEVVNGGYFSEVKRFEGAIEDIAIWNTALTGTSDATRDRDTKLDIEEVDAGELLNFWPMTDGDQRVIREATGRGNHLYFSPDFPVLDEQSGGLRSDRAASWWFNGATSYALCDLDGNPNWRERQRYDEDEDRESLGSWTPVNPARAGWLQQSILAGSDFGIHVEFQVDALEPFEQVLAEIHGVFRCAIRADGRLQLYHRDKGGGTRPFVHSYRPLVYSSLVVKPGERYAVQFAVFEGKAVIAVNGAIDAQVTFSSTTDPDTHPVGGLTIGMGSRRFTISNDKRTYSGFSVAAGATGSQIAVAGSTQTVDIGDIVNVSSSSLGTGSGNNGDYIVTELLGPTAFAVEPALPFGGSDTGTLRVKSIFQASRLPAPVNGLNTDFRSGFLGRIEKVKILAGRSLESITSIRDEDSGDWKFPIVPLYRVPSVANDTSNTYPYFIRSRDTVTPTDFTTNPGDNAVGQGVKIQGVTNTDDMDRVLPDLRYNINANIGSADSMQPAVPSLAGVEASRAAFDLFFVIGHWSLDRSFDDTDIIGGRFANEIEWRQETPDSLDAVEAARVDGIRFVARQRTPIEDDVGNLGPLEARCIEPDILTEAEDHRVVARSLSAPTREFSFVRARIWQEFSPREIGPRWSEGLVLPNLDDSRISLIADVDDQRSGERFVFTALGRNLYWAKQIWRDDSPFPDESGSVWLFGQPGEHIRGGASSTTQRLGVTGGAFRPVNSEMWVKPQRLDGIRVMWGVCDPVNNRINYLVGTYDGAIFVCGTLSNSTESWFYFSGTNGTPSFTSRDNWFVTSTQLRLQEWNHVHVTVGTTGVPVRVFVNGSPVEMAALDGTLVPGVGFTPDGLSTISSPDTSQLMFIGGFPEGYEQFTLTTAVGTSPTSSRTFKVQSWHGMMTEFRSAPEIDARFPLTGAGTVPQSRYTSSAGTGYHISLGEKDGWVFENKSPGLGGDSAQSQIKEMVLVADNLGDSRFDRYDFAVFRDALYITNGVGRMQEVRFRRFSHPEGPFSCTNAGIIAPAPATADISMEIGPPTSLLERWGGNPRVNGNNPLIPLTDIQPPEVMQPGLYQVFVSFYDERGRESEPALLDQIQTTELPPLLPEGARTNDASVADNGSGLTRVTTSAVHGLSTGQQAELLGFGSEYDGIHTVTVITTSTFDISIPFGGSGFNHTAMGGPALGGWWRPPSATPVIDLFNDSAGDVWVNFGGGWDPYTDEQIPTTEARQASRPRAGEYLILEVTTGTAAIPVGWYALRFLNRNGTSGVWAFPGSENCSVNVGAGGGSLVARVYPSSLYIDRLPRSTESHVVGRRIYVSPSGGGVPVRTLDVPDNVTDSVTVTGPGPVGALGVEIGRKLIPPKARLVAVDQGRMVIANLTDVEAGRSAFAWSDPTEVTYWPLPNTAVLDSENGESVIGLGSTLGNFYLSKRNSIWAFEPNTPSIRPVNQSVGVGGGLTLYDNVMIGSGERGVYYFDGSNVVYASSSLEGEWNSGVPVTDTDLLNHFGAFHRDESQWWLSARAPTTIDGTPLTMRANRRIWVLHTQAGDNQAWTRLTVPPHTYMRGITDPVSQRPEILIGGSDGRLLRYNREVFIDGQNDEPGPSQIALGLTQNALIGGAFSGGSLLLAKVTGRVIDFSPLVATLGLLDIVQGGLRGMQMLLISTAFPPTVARCRSNTATTITLDVDTGATNADVLFEVGSYDAYYTTPWVASRPNKTIVAKNYILEFEASEADLVVRWASAIQTAQGSTLVKPDRTWAPPVFGADTISLRRGFQAQHGRIDEANRGRYFRMWVGTTPSALSLAGNSTLGIRNPWTVQTVQFEHTEEDGGFV
jgi:hypothetical protein